MIFVSFWENVNCMYLRKNQILTLAPWRKLNGIEQCRFKITKFFLFLAKENCFIGSLVWRNQYGPKNNFSQGTVRRNSIHPFADFSSKMAIFKEAEKYLNDENSSKFLQYLLLLIGKAFWFGFGPIIFSASENTSF